MRPIDADFVLHCAECEFSEDDASKVRWLISHIPTIDAEPVRHGRWIPQDNTRTKYMCGDCKARNYDGSGNYCPNCGAKMDEEVEG